MKDKLPRIQSIEELKQLFREAEKDIESGKPLADILERAEMRSLARAVADLTRGQTERPIERPMSRHYEPPMRRLAPLGGRGSGPAPKQRSLTQILHRG